MKNPSQAPKGVPVSPKLESKQVKQVYRRVSKKNNVNTNDSKKKDDEYRKVVRNLNPFDVLNSVENDIDLGTNKGASNLASIEKCEDEVEPVDNEMTSFLASDRFGYSTNSLLKQWRRTYENANSDYDQYNDDMYEGREIQ
ncbi:hypothetical protein Tco_0245168 [Tanacetum coccineum]